MTMVELRWIDQPDGGLAGYVRAGQGPARWLAALGRAAEPLLAFLAAGDALLALAVPAPLAVDWALTALRGIVADGIDRRAAREERQGVGAREIPVIGRPEPRAGRTDRRDRETTRARRAAGERRMATSRMLEALGAERLPAGELWRLSGSRTIQPAGDIAHDRGAPRRPLATPGVGGTGGSRPTTETLDSTVPGVSAARESRASIETGAPTAPGSPTLPPPSAAATTLVALLGERLTREARGIAGGPRPATSRTPDVTPPAVATGTPSASLALPPVSGNGAGGVPIPRGAGPELGRAIAEAAFARRLNGPAAARLLVAASAGRFHTGVASMSGGIGAGLKAAPTLDAPAVSANLAPPGSPWRDVVLPSSAITGNEAGMVPEPITSRTGAVAPLQPPTLSLLTRLVDLPPTAARENAAPLAAVGIDSNIMSPQPVRPRVENTFNVTVHVEGGPADETELADLIAHILVDQARRHGIDVG